MERIVLLHLIEKCGNQTKAVSERWKDISHICIDNSRTIARFEVLAQRGEVVFVDKDITAGGETGKLTGFYVLETMLPNTTQLLDGPKHMTFIPCEHIQGLSFWNTAVPTVTDLNAFMTATYI
jgi:hypothetical protein